MAASTCVAISKSENPPKRGRPLSADMSDRAQALRLAFPSTRRRCDAEELGCAESYLRKIVNQGVVPGWDLAVAIASKSGLRLRVVLDVEVPANVEL